jgi:hypothetical protein
LTKNDEKQRFLQMVTPNKGFLLFSKKKKRRKISVSNGSSFLSKTACATDF